VNIIISENSSDIAFIFVKFARFNLISINSANIILTFENFSVLTSENFSVLISEYFANIALILENFVTIIKTRVFQIDFKRFDIIKAEVIQMRYDIE
jgi:hypothetical protein